MQEMHDAVETMTAAINDGINEGLAAIKDVAGKYADLGRHGWRLRTQHRACIKSLEARNAKARNAKLEVKTAKLKAENAELKAAEGECWVCVSVSGIAE
jgi:CxxC motif-containing protein (DUF1111 family)